MTNKVCGSKPSDKNNLHRYLKVKTSWSDTEVTYTNPSNSNTYTVLQLVVPFCVYSAKEKPKSKKILAEATGKESELFALRHCQWQATQFNEAYKDNASKAAAWPSGNLTSVANLQVKTWNKTTSWMLMS